MEKVVLQFEDYDATMDRVRDKASSEGISLEQLIRRAIGLYLGCWGLNDAPKDAAPQSLQELFELTGVMRKPITRVLAEQKVANRRQADARRDEATVVPIASANEPQDQGEQVAGGRLCRVE